MLSPPTRALLTFTIGTNVGTSMSTSRSSGLTVVCRLPCAHSTLVQSTNKNNKKYLVFIFYAFCAIVHIFSYTPFSFSVQHSFVLRQPFVHPSIILRFISVMPSLFLLCFNGGRSSSLRRINEDQSKDERRFIEASRTCLLLFCCFLFSLLFVGRCLGICCRLFLLCFRRHQQFLVSLSVL